jgi:crossover junction endodeoxyribonuclease RuvC
MRIAGIDLGSQRTGFALIESQGNELRVLDLGTWDLLSKSKERDAVGIRLEKLHRQSSLWLRLHNPDIIGFEKAVAFKNIPSALTLSEARGVLRLAMFQNLASSEKRLVELSPTAVKKASGSGGLASKEAVLKALCMRFSGLQEIMLKNSLPPDAFDALAIAFTAWLQVRNTLFGRNFNKTLEV